MSTTTELKVGAFVLAGLFAAGLVVFLIGDERRMFEGKVNYQAVFNDVQGLTEGSPVRMGGVDIGRVDHVGYTNDHNDVRLHVTLEIVESEGKRIRQDSVASVENKGLLGDKMISIKVGSPSEPPVPVGGEIQSQESPDLSALMDRIAVIGEKAEVVMANLEKTTSTVAREDFREDLRSAVSSLSRILKAIDEGDGLASKLLHDPEEGAKISRTLTNIEHSSARLDRAMAGINQTIDRVNTGPGLVHEVVYGEESAKAIAQFGRAADEVATTLQGVREGNGIAHSLIYGDEGSQQLMGDLNAMAHDLRGIVADMRKGKGTLGALLVDPSVYEDIKMLLGNVERNKALRALVRYSIQRDEKVQSVQVRDGHAVSDAPAASGKLSGSARD